MSIEKIIPAVKNIPKKSNAGIGWKILCNKMKASGMRSVIETQIITPAAKDKAQLISRSLFLTEKKIGIVPMRVESPAREDNKKAYVILDIGSPNFFYVSIPIIILFYIKINNQNFDNR